MTPDVIAPASTSVGISEIVLLIGVITTSVVTIINTVALHWGHKKLDAAEKDRADVKSTLATVKDNTNGRLDDAMKRMSNLEELNAHLSALVEKRGRFKTAANARAASARRKVVLGPARGKV